MEAVLVSLARLACPLGMVLMMFFMGKGMMGGRRRDADAPKPQREATESLEVLRERRERIDERIAELEGERTGR